MRVGDDLLIDEVGTIRWRNFRLEGRILMRGSYYVGAEDEFESKWSDNALHNALRFMWTRGPMLKLPRMMFARR